MVDGSGAAPEAVPSPASQRVTAEPARAWAREPTLEPHVESKNPAALLRARRPILQERDLKKVALGPPPPAGAGATNLQVTNYDNLSTPTPGEEHCSQLL